jgi:hypothetical protein
MFPIPTQMLKSINNMKQFITEAQRLQKLAGIEPDSDLIQNIIDLYIDLYDENSELKFLNFLLLFWFIYIYRKYIFKG